MTWLAPDLLLYRRWVAGYDITDDEYARILAGIAAHGHPHVPVLREERCVDEQFGDAYDIRNAHKE